MTDRSRQMLWSWLKQLALISALGGIWTYTIRIEARLTRIESALGIDAPAGALASPAPRR